MKTPITKKTRRKSPAKSAKKATAKTARKAKVGTMAEQAKAAILAADPEANLNAQLALDAASDYAAASKFLDREGGFTYECQTESGTFRREHPEVKIKQDAWQRLLRILKEYKLTLKELEGRTAGSRSKKINPKKPGKDNILSFVESR